MSSKLGKNVILISLQNKKYHLLVLRHLNEKSSNPFYSIRHSCVPRSKTHGLMEQLAELCLHALAVGSLERRSSQFRPLFHPYFIHRSIHSFILLCSLAKRKEKAKFSLASAHLISRSFTRENRDFFDRSFFRVSDFLFRHIDRGMS